MKEIKHVIKAEPGWLTIWPIVSLKGDFLELVVAEPPVAWVFGVDEDGDIEVSGFSPLGLSVAGEHGLDGVDKDIYGPITYWQPGRPFKHLWHELREHYAALDKFPTDVRFVWEPELRWLDPERYEEFKEAQREQ